MLADCRGVILQEGIASLPPGTEVTLGIGLHFGRIEMGIVGESGSGKELVARANIAVAQAGRGDAQQIRINDILFLELLVQ